MSNISLLWHGNSFDIWQTCFNWWWHAFSWTISLIERLLVAAESRIRRTGRLCRVAVWTLAYIVLHNMTRAINSVQQHFTVQQSWAHKTRFVKSWSCWNGNWMVLCGLGRLTTGLLCTQCCFDLLLTVYNLENCADIDILCFILELLTVQRCLCIRQHLPSHLNAACILPGLVVTLGTFTCCSGVPN